MADILEKANFDRLYQFEVEGLRRWSRLRCYQ